jgi:predicted TIM-barrel fold metal-dependent hydrolase
MPTHSSLSTPHSALGFSWLDTHIHVHSADADMADDLMAVLDGMGEDVRFVLSPGLGLHEMIRDEADGALRVAEFICDLVRRAPERLYGACCVNLNFPEESLRVMDLCLGEMGFVMVGEMLGYLLNFDMDCDAGEAVLRKAVEYDVPVQIHLSTSNSPSQGHTSGMKQLDDIMAISARVPEARIIVAHMVGMLKDDPPVVSEYLDVIEERLGGWPDNWWAEIIDFHSPGVPVALARIPHNRLLVGSDWTTRFGPPYLPYGVDHLVWAGEECPYDPSVHALVEFLRQWGASEETLRKIAFDNAAELLRIGE